MTKTFTQEPGKAIKRPIEERYTTLKAMEDLRNIWFSHFDGDLATICRENHPLTGYPVGSVVPYVLDDQYYPIMLLGHIAEHTNNALENPKASLFIREHKHHEDVQTQWRICAIGDLTPIKEEEYPQISARYFAHYPQAISYDETHKFSFFRLRPKKFRIIMGFGDIRWIAADAPFKEAPLEEALRQQIIEHMNKDHQDALRHYLRHIKNGIKELSNEAQVKMVHIQAWGATLKHKDGLFFLPFEKALHNIKDIRETLVKLAKT